MGKGEERRAVGVNPRNGQMEMIRRKKKKIIKISLCCTENGKVMKCIGRVKIH